MAEMNILQSITRDTDVGNILMDIKVGRGEG